MAFSVVNDIPLKNGKFNFLQNTRVLTTGVLEGRPRLNSYLTFNRANTQEVPHDIKTIIDKITSSFNRIVGVGTEIWTGNGVLLQQKDTGYSGKPLSIFDFRPEEAVQAFCYIADSLKFRKISVDDQISDVGINVPTKPIAWNIAKPERKIIDSIEAGSEADWNHLTGSASVPTLETRVSTTITSYLADSAEPAFASIVPAAFGNEIQAGAIVKLNGAAEVEIEDVIPSAVAAGIATISKITYDVGATGLCTIILSVPVATIRRDSILLLNGTEYVRVQDVTLDDKGIPSIRTSTIGTFAATNTVSGAASFRFYSTVAYAATNTIVGKYIKSAITAAGISSITRTFNVNLLDTGTKALTLDDIFHISLKSDIPANITEIQIQLDVNSGTNNFEEQYYFYSLGPNFFTALADQSSSVLDVIQQATLRQLSLDQARNQALATKLNADYDPIAYDNLIGQLGGTTTETTLGREQWTELFIPLRAFNRVGADASRTLKDIKAVRISVNCTDAVEISLDSIWVGGSAALDSNIQGFLPYNYVWRIRNPATREISNWSPPLRTGIKITRGQIQLTFPVDITALYPNTYEIDIARYGGTLNDFRLLGTIKNDGSTYTDNSSDRRIADNELAGRLEGNIDAVFDYYKPFAFIDTPKSGVCNIVGTTLIWVSGDKLNISYPRGTLIVIDGKVNTFYSNPISTGAANVATKVELEIDMGSLTNVKFECQEPLLTGQPLSAVFGPFGEGNFGLFFFGIRLGILYWLDGNSPGTQGDQNQLEITSPSEPLLAGVIYDGLPYVWSTEKSFQIVPTYSGEQFGFIARENANSRGLFSQWAIVAGRDYIYHLTENADGIVRVAGNGNPQYITEGVSSLFYNNGKPPTITTVIDGTEIYPPDFTLTEHLRFFSIKDYVFFRFRDTQGKDRCLVFDEKLNDWISYDVYINDKINGIYFEEKESQSQILVGIPDGVGRFSNTGAYELNQLAKAAPFSFDAGDANLTKEFKEQILSADPGTETGFKYRNYYNNGPTADGGFFDAAFKILTGIPGHKRTRYIESLQDTDNIGVYARNITPVFEWQIISPVKLYELINYYLPQGDEITDRAGDVEYAEGLGERLWQGIVIEANTFGIDKQLDFYNDKGILKASITINCDGRQTIAKSFDQPFISHTIKRTSTDGINWLPYNEVYVFDPEPESAQVWEGEFNISDLNGIIMMKRMGIAYRSDADSTITLNFDDGTTQQYPLPNSNEDWHKEFFYLICKKWKACKYRIESEGNIRLYKKHSEVWMRSVNSQEGFLPMHPMGGDSNITDIRI